MGYRTQNHYDEYNDRMRKRMLARLPWYQRFDWPMIVAGLLKAAIGYAAWRFWNLV